jgi:membrane glycosyltransferase
LEPGSAHRLLVALALLVWLSPAYATSVQPLLEVLGAKETVGKKVKGWKMIPCSQYSCCFFALHMYEAG